MTGADFLPYGRHTVEPDDIAAVVAVLEGGPLTGGPMVPRFEQALAGAVQAREAVAVSSGTAALHAACAAAGIGPGDRVLVPALTFVATANCACLAGAEPVFADVDPETGLLPAEEIERRAGPRIRAVIPVHLTGAAADLRAIGKAAEACGATVIEDATHALGGRGSEGPIGSCGRASAMAAFSFHPVKHIATGEGGAVTTDSPELAERLRRFRNHGIVRDPAALQAPSPGPWYYEQQSLGHNLRMSDLQAALGLSQLAKLPRFVARRRELAARYDRLLAGLPAVRPVATAEARTGSACHLYSVRIDFAGLGIDRADVMRGLRERGIGSQVHYIPLPLHPFYRERGWRIEDFPGARRYYERTLSLPLFPAMADGDVDRVVAALAEVLQELGAGP